MLLSDYGELISNPEWQQAAAYYIHERQHTQSSQMLLTNQRISWTTISNILIILSFLHHIDGRFGDILLLKPTRGIDCRATHESPHMYFITLASLLSTALFLC